MDFREYQEKSSQTAIYPPADALVYLILGLNGEAGEVADLYKKSIRNGDGQSGYEIIDEIMDELGDVLWYIAQIGVYFNVSIEDIAKNNIRKLEKRYK